MAFFHSFDCDSVFGQLRPVCFSWMLLKINTSVSYSIFAPPDLNNFVIDSAPRDSWENLYMNSKCTDIIGDTSAAPLNSYRRVSFVVGCTCCTFPFLLYMQFTVSRYWI